MATGISIPARANKRGGFARSVGSVNVRKLLATALGNNDSNNPFQELGLGRIIFDPGDETTFADVTEQIRQIFEGFRIAEIAELQDRSDNLVVEQRGEGEYEMRLYFIDLETGLPGEATVSGGITGLFVR